MDKIAYRLINSDIEVNADGVRVRADDDGCFRVAPGSRVEEILLLAGAVPAYKQSEAIPVIQKPSTGELSAGGVALKNGSLDSARRAIQREFKKSALIQAPAWASGATVQTKYLRRHSNGQLLVCVYSGTTGATEPAYNDAQPMQDNTAIWWAVGRESRVNNDGYPVPAVSVSTTITGLTAKSFWANQGMVYSPTCPTNIQGSSGNSTIAWCFTDGGTTDAQTLGVGKRGWNRVIEFDSDAPKLAIGSWNAYGTRINVFVDGYPLEEDVTMYDNGLPCYYIIDFSAKGGRKARHYRVEMAGNQTITGIAVDARSYVVPGDTTGTRGIWISDSYGSSVSSYSFAVDTYLSERVMKRLGIKWTRNMHLGGTGYVATKGGTLYNAPQVLANNPQADWPADVIVCAHGFNDVQAPTYASVADTIAAAVATWALLRAQHPTAAIVIVGPWAGSTGPSASLISLDAGLSAAVAQSGDQRMAYISTIGAPGGSWVTGTGNSSALSGTGNADFFIGADSTHPTYPGRQYHEDRLVAAIDAAIASLAN